LRATARPATLAAMGAGRVFSEEAGSESAVPSPPAARLQSPGVARVLALQRSIGNRATTRQLQRYKILGPWNTGQAVHETLTVLAVGEAIHELEAAGIDPGELMAGFDVDKLPDLGKKASFDPVDAPASFQQFIRGVVWADDPKGLLFDKDEDATDYSSGYMWYSEFGEGEKGKFAADKSDLISRSHFGDLQFFHGMASVDKEAATTTKQHMLDWARFLIDVATARTAADAKVKDVAAIKDIFPANADWTIKQLFGWAKASDVQTRQRAVGILFHLIQDSHAAGHVERDDKGDIVEFHAYGGQDEHEHGKYDYFAKAATLRESIAQTKGAASARQRCTEVLKLIARKQSTDEIVKFLDETVFKLAASTRGAGAGTGLGKKPKVTVPPVKMDPGKI
jgi:hypothetical protein